MDLLLPCCLAVPKASRYIYEPKASRSLPATPRASLARLSDSIRLRYVMGHVYAIVYNYRL